MSHFCPCAEAAGLWLCLAGSYLYQEELQKPRDKPTKFRCSRGDSWLWTVGFKALHQRPKALPPDCREAARETQLLGLDSPRCAPLPASPIHYYFLNTVSSRLIKCSGDGLKGEIQEVNFCCSFHSFFNGPMERALTQPCTTHTPDLAVTVIRGRGAFWYCLAPGMYSQAAPLHVSDL